ncbi:winged helix-turn-helix domain-containing protein [Enterococcus sp. BWR-S5]|uniref:winged helix-turn-helix domain-containing protein n=1 Tax=Enterococcus sp. BWR-S5 TaxID=2787714 RepID=UPI001920DEA8|nr:winged helix-turn-helix domain-containing protein [Enterococcus sp. BWR-S5]MBL1226010.1 winged helix-turn-helix transcriptional regulator [Enterococcus sp. BWR-S5]
MFSLDCISLTNDEKEKKYIEQLTSLNVKVMNSNPFHEYEISDEADGIIIFEKDLNSAGEVCKFIIELKRRSNALLWVFVTKEMSSSKLFYLQMGADVVFSYDSDVNETILTIMNGLKRYKDAENVLEQPHTASNKKDFALNPRNLSISKEGKEIPLPRIEYKTMELFLDNVNKALSYQEIYKGVWGTEEKYRKYRVANVIFYLRKKVEEDALEPKYIRTVRSKGYMLTV